MTEELFSLQGKVAFITGAAAGIGAGISLMLARAGAVAIVADRDAEGARRQAAVIENAGHRAIAAHIDMADEFSIVRAFKDVTEAHGAPWVVVNNAGIQDRELLLEATAAEWDRMVAINARGPFLLLREAARAMVASGNGGRIVNISSLGVRHPMIGGLSAYTASKGALLALTQNAAYELAPHGITANAVLPGAVETAGAKSARGPAADGPGRRRGRLGTCEPHDIAAAVLFFASPAARFITNQVLAVDGGFMLT